MGNIPLCVCIYMRVCICVCIYVYTHTHREAYIHTDFLGGSMVNNPPTNAGDVGLIPGSGISAEGNGNQLQYSCHGQRSLVGSRPWGHKELDMI